MTTFPRPAPASRRAVVRCLWVACIIGPSITGIPLFAAQSDSAQPTENGRRWLAGDHHIHSRYSVGLDRSTEPPTPIISGPDGEPYPIAMNALMAKHHGLSWMVSTDHGGPNHSKINLEKAYPELVHSRNVVPEVIQFYGMELNPPAADHASLIVPHSDHEHKMLFEIESGYDKAEVYPRDPKRDTEEKMIEALTFMGGLSPTPVVIANHPSRSAGGLGVYGQDRPDELRNWNDAAPNVAVGMEGSPGHQANAINPDGSIDPTGARGGYRFHPTMGGFDQMTARLGGFWDSMLGEGRRWWVTANSDSHKNWREEGSDFWPGEYSKTYVFAEKTHDDILHGIRHGRIFVTTGDLISELHVTASSNGAEASIGGTLGLAGRKDVTVTIRLRDPAGTNHRGENQQVARVDLIVGDIIGPVADRTQDTHPSTRVVKRFTSEDWTKAGEHLTMTYTLQNIHHSSYVRVRGTNSSELEPTPDPKGEDPWSDLWFYANPIFIELK